jgi:CXXX repeat peptide maturase
LSCIAQNSIIGSAMDKIKSIWLLLSPDAVLCCNESEQPAGKDNSLMSLGLFAKIAELAEQRSWRCKILCNNGGIPPAYLKLCNKTKTEIVFPAGHEDPISHSNTTIVFESDQINLADKHPSASRSILRIKRDNLSQLSEIVSALFGQFSDVSIRHPQLLSYDNQDMDIYKEQLFEIGRRLLAGNELWSGYRLDCLTGRFWMSGTSECGAGIKSLAVGPAGELYLCPAAVHNSAAVHDGKLSCGHVLEALKLPNRHLFTREYSVPCGKCGALHCLRCVYLNKISTFEFCVPPKKLCQLANFELEVQVRFAREAMERNLWNPAYNFPDPPEVYDPYELIKAEEDLPVIHSWRRLVAFDGQAENLQSSMMLDIIHELYGWCQALVACAESGHSPSVELIEQDMLSTLRRRTIEQYRDVIFQKDCPTVHEIELLMCNAAEKILTCHKEYTNASINQ